MCTPVYDTHVHTISSCDCDVRMDEYCRRAVSEGISGICFTDHIDYNKNDEGYGYYNQKNYFDDLYRVRKEYNGRLEILAGIEFSEPHMYKNQLCAVNKEPYDCILGSIHYWYKDMFPSVMVKNGVPAELCYSFYWEEVLKTVSAGGFDILAHIDFPKRYYDRLIFEPDMLIKIFKAMIKNNIQLEINTSSLRKGLNQPMPGEDILKLYRDAGGKYIALGSDAHTPEDMASHFTQARALAQHFGFHRVIYKNREMRIVN